MANVVCCRGRSSQMLITLWLTRVGCHPRLRPSSSRSGGAGQWRLIGQRIVRASGVKRCSCSRRLARRCHHAIRPSPTCSAVCRPDDRHRGAPAVAPLSARRRRRHGSWCSAAAVGERDFATDLRGDGYMRPAPAEFVSSALTGGGWHPLRWAIDRFARAALTTAVRRPGGRASAATISTSHGGLRVRGGPSSAHEIDDQRRGPAPSSSMENWGAAQPSGCARRSGLWRREAVAAESFARSRGLARDGVATVLIGSAGDRAAGGEVLAAARSAPIDLIGRTDLSALGNPGKLPRLVRTTRGALHFGLPSGSA